MNEDLADAIRFNDMDEVKRLALLAGKNINKKNNKSFNALFWAIEYSKLEAIEFLLTLPDLNLEIKNRDKETPLARSILKENIEVLHLLLKAGANINVLDYKGGNLLLASARNEQIFQEMLKHDLDLHNTNEINDTPFIYLSRIDKFKRLEVLVNHAQSIEDIDKFDEQRKIILKLRSKNQYIAAIKADNISTEILEKARLRFNLEKDLPEKSVIKNHKI